MNLNQITIYAHKPAETVEFFQKLGLRLIVDSMPRYARLLCPDGDATLSVHEAEEISAGSNVVLYFECEDLDAKVAELKNAGLQFETEPVDQTWLWREAYLRDPGGNKICLFYAGETVKIRPGKLKIKSFLNFKPAKLEQISIKDNPMAVGKNVGTRPGACPMSAAKRRSNLSNFEYHHTFERHAPLWAGTRPAPTFCFVLLKSALFLRKSSATHFFIFRQLHLKADLTRAFKYKKEEK